MKHPRWIVTRQCYWPDGRLVVEIAYGGRDYCNPDALCKKYSGEFEEYSDPREAVEAAIAILKSWRKDCKKRISLTIGNTGGNTIPFDDCTIREAIAWGKEEYETMPKCDRCGGLLVDQPYIIWDYPYAGKFCSEYCAEMVYADMHEEEVNNNE